MVGEQLKVDVPLDLVKQLSPAPKTLRVSCGRLDGFPVEYLVENISNPPPYPATAVQVFPLFVRAPYQSHACLAVAGLLPWKMV